MRMNEKRNVFGLFFFVMLITSRPHEVATNGGYGAKTAITIWIIHGPETRKMVPLTVLIRPSWAARGKQEWFRKVARVGKTVAGTKKRVLQLSSLGLRREISDILHSTC